MEETNGDTNEQDSKQYMRGTCLFYNADQKYGFIRPDDPEHPNVYFHCNSVEPFSKDTVISPGQKCSFHREERTVKTDFDKTEKRYYAENVIPQDEFVELDKTSKNAIIKEKCDGFCLWYDEDRNYGFIKLLVNNLKQETEQIDKECLSLIISQECEVFFHGQNVVGTKPLVEGQKVRFQLCRTKENRFKAFRVVPGKILTHNNSYNTEHKGTIKMFDPARKFGFIAPEINGAKDVIFFYSNIKSESNVEETASIDLQVGQEVTFKIRPRKVRKQKSDNSEGAEVQKSDNAIDIVLGKVPPPKSATYPVLRGVCTCFNKDRGFGFIVYKNGSKTEEFFFHAKSIIQNENLVDSTIQANQPCKFKRVPDQPNDRSHRLRAIEVVALPMKEVKEEEDDDDVKETNDLDTTEKLRAEGLSEREIQKKLRNFRKKQRKKLAKQFSKEQESESVEEVVDEVVDDFSEVVEQVKKQDSAVVRNQRFEYKIRTEKRYDLPSRSSSPSSSLSSEDGEEVPIFRLKSKPFNRKKLLNSGRSKKKRVYSRRKLEDISARKSSNYSGQLFTSILEFLRSLCRK